MTTLFEQLQYTAVPAMATPLDASGHKIDTKAIPALVNFLIDREVGGIFVGGSTGEGLLFSVTERKRLHKASIKAAKGRVPILLHVGANTTADAVELAKDAAKLKAVATVAIPPTFFKATNRELLGYFKAVAEAAPKLPLLLYDIPRLAINEITPELIGMVTAEIPQFAGVKCSRPDAMRVRELIHALPHNKLFMAGSERILLGSLAMGATGTVSGLATAIPEPFVAMVSAYGAGRIDEAQRWHRIINQLIDTLASQPRIGGIKAVLEARGVVVGAPAAPRQTVSNGTDLWQACLAYLEQVAHDK